MKISYSLRAFAIYFVILGSLIWFTLDNAIERLNDGMRQSAESVLVDMANVLASLFEDQLKHANSPHTEQLSRVFESLGQRDLSAQIYQVTKQSVDSQVYVTNQKGIVIFDSQGQHTGQDFSKWRDVRLTLEGQYGARTSYIDQTRTEPDDPKAMVIAAPIRSQNQVIGVVSVLKPINSLEVHLLTESQQLQRYAFALLLLALIIGYVLSLWFTHSLNRIANYANDMSEGKKVEPPLLHDSRLAALTDSISHMRKQLDGKEYVENYIHGLTHELKTPITSIGGAIELIDDDMPADDRARFLNNINTSNNRMSRLVDRVLSLAKLEGLTELVATSEFNLVPTLTRLLEERAPTIHNKNININYPSQSHFYCIGDKVLIGQAIANLLDNAIRFCDTNGTIDIRFSDQQSNDKAIYEIAIFNQGALIPDFALDKLYDRFFSLPSQHNQHNEHKEPNNIDSQAKSTGLGLSFVREIMKLHAGQVQLKNTDNGVLATLIWPRK